MDGSGDEMIQEDRQWKLATSAANRDYLQFIGVPPPTSTTHRSFSVEVVRGGGVSKQQGYATVSLIWDILTEAQYKVVKALVMDVLANVGWIYVTVVLDGLDVTWQDIKGYPKDLTYSKVDDTYNTVYAAVTLNLNAVTLE